jgi:Zincin-like metallopeptidase
VGWNVIVKRVKGRGYLYWQRSYREAGRATPRTVSKYIGPVDAVRAGMAKFQMDFRNELEAGAENVEEVCRKVGLDATDTTVVGQLFDTQHAEPGWGEGWTSWADAKFDINTDVLATRHDIMDLPLALEIPIVTSAFVSRNELDGNAWFDTVEERIQIPNQTRFRAVGGLSAEQHFYKTFLHGLSHATTMFKQGRRRGPKLDADAAYALEEVTVELAAGMLAVRFGVTDGATGVGADYIQGWFEVLVGLEGGRRKAMLLRTAIGNAKRIVEFLSEVYSDG